VRCWAVDLRSRVVSAVAGVAKAALLAASSSHACAVISDGKILCWGSNKFGALGRGDADEAEHPEGRVVEF
jgi:alpha-tubulin suppressor-like RCC1 family protein